MNGKLIVIDGIDGAGKTTQIELLKEYLASQDQALELIDFPRYEDNLYGKLVKRYLDGEFGDINQTNPYLLALAYAGDRALAKPEIENWLNEGSVVIANRYVSASKAHLGANLAENERENFMEWIYQLEYQTNGIPKPDLNIFLNIDPKIGQQNVKVKHNPDMHEKNIEHEEMANKIYLELTQAEENWVVVNCMIGDKMRPKEDIHKEIIVILNDNNK